MRTWIVVAGAFAAVAFAAPGAPRQGTRQGASSAMVKRGEYLATVGGCSDCHTPFKMGPNGPEKDVSRLLSGHPEALEMPPAPPPTGPWLASASGTFTAWAGPWGVSFSANLTPDAVTGLGGWTAEQFVAAMRTGRHRGSGRQILPPMPWEDFAKMTDADLKAMFAYLQSIPPLRNRVPEPVPPPAPAAQAGEEAPSGGTGSGGNAPGR